MSKTVCPHCFERHAVKQLHMHCPVACGRDAVVFPPAGLCPHGQRPQSSRWCPTCGTVLEYDYIHTAGRTIALIGATSSGKSTYVGVLVRELRNRVSAAFDGMSVEFVGDRSRDRYEATFATPLFRQGRAPTMTATAQSEAPAPLLFSLKFPERRRFGFGRDGVRPAMVTFFDTAGEDVHGGQEMRRLARYLASARGIILLVDPLQVPSVGHTLAADLAQDAMDEQSKVVTQLAALLREEKRLSPSKRLDVPLAIVLSKTDALGPTVGEHSPLLRRHEHPGLYDEADGAHVHDEVHAWLQRWYGVEYAAIVANNFSRYRYFGVSALGTPPQGEILSTGGVHPLRVEDPLLWLLAEFSLIGAARSR